MTQKFFAMIVGTVLFVHKDTGEHLSVLTNAVHARDVSDEVLTINAPVIGVMETALINSAGLRAALDQEQYVVQDVVVQNIIMLGAMTSEEFTGDQAETAEAVETAAGESTAVDPN